MSCITGTGTGTGGNDHCRVWSLTDDSRFTGLCSMILYPQTCNETESCELCATPVQETTEDDPPYDGPPLIQTNCATWFVQRRYFGALCSMLMQAETGNPSCPVCASPVATEE